MTLININNLDASVIKRELHAISGITPEIAEKIGRYMDANGIFKNKAQFMELLRELNVEPNFLEAIDFAVGVLPPAIFLFPGDPKKDDFFDEPSETEITDEETGEKKKICTWKFRITAIKEREKVEVDLKPIPLKFTLTPNVAATRNLSVVTGAVSYECKETDGENCLPKPFNLDYDPLPDVEDTDVTYDIPDAFEEILKKADIEVTQPTLETTSSVQVVPVNDSRCYRVTVITNLKFTEGRIKGEIEINKVKVTIDVRLVSTFSDTFITTYRLCCARFDKSAKILGVDVKDKDKTKLVPVDDSADISKYPIEAENCGCECVFTHLKSKRKNAAAPLRWTVEALEGGGRRKFIEPQQVEEPLRFDEKNPPISKKKRDEQGNVMNN